jgi:membrane protease YdiL (CAAX protease family)
MIAQRTRLALDAAPVLVVATMWPVFKVLTARYGPRLGYFLAFVVYWLGWCTLFPLWAVGFRGIRESFGPGRSRFGQPTWLGVGSLIGPLVLAYASVFPRLLPRATPKVLIASFGLAVVNAVGEEVLWRGAFLRRARSRRGPAALWPVVGFALWHYAPLSVHPNRRPGGNHAFVGVSLLLGLLWSRLANSAGSIRWTALSHVLFDFAGLGALAYRR